DALELAADGARQCGRERRLADSGDVLDEQVAAREQTDHGQPHRLGLADDAAADVVLEPPDERWLSRHRSFNSTGVGRLAVQTFCAIITTMADAPRLQGSCEPAFGALRDALEAIVASGAEVGAALAVHVDKHPVIDLSIGHRDAARTLPWQADTLVNLYS